jgi:hypothetical protein
MRFRQRWRIPVRVRRSLDEVKLDAMDGLGLVEVETDDLWAGGGGSPAGGDDLANGVLDGEVLVFGGYFDACDSFEVAPEIADGCCGCGGRCLTMLLRICV